MFKFHLNGLIQILTILIYFLLWYNFPQPFAVKFDKTNFFNLQQVSNEVLQMITFFFRIILNYLVITAVKIYSNSSVKNKRRIEKENENENISCLQQIKHLFNEEYY